ncbi:two-component system, HptB-dependent secretion and biofilm response regulator [Gammaproteobacteria bacterium]
MLNEMNSSVLSVDRRYSVSEGKNLSALQTILVVDDNPEVLALVAETLRSEYQIQVATSGSLALMVLERSPMVDLILLDVVMPGMDGFEVCQRIKEIPAWHNIPIIFLTALNKDSDEAYGFGLGAVDYIAKPVVPIILRARVNTHMELRRVSQELQYKNEILSDEREIIEGMIIRMRADPDFDNRYLRWLMRPVERTSGDICLSAFCPDGRQMVLVGDFTGHGLTAAIGGPGVKQMFYSLCAKRISMIHLLTTINDLLSAQLLTSQFMTVHLVEVNSERRQIHLWGGGMSEPLYANAFGEVRRISVSGIPLGVMPGLNISDDVQILNVKPGERLLLYTDGIIEAKNAVGEMYQIDRLDAKYAAVLRNGGELCELIDDLDIFLAGRSQKDDVLLLELSV